MTIHHMHHVGLTVTDLDRSAEFYSTAFDYTEVMRQEMDAAYLGQIVGLPGARVKMAHLRLRDAPHVLELFEYVTPVVKKAPLQPNHAGNAHLCFIVDDIAADHARLVSQGVTFISPPVFIDAGRNAGGVSCYLRDPDGITLELFQSPERNDDQ
ncbi:VOC family protein [Nocardioides bigeumensis]|uniref:VOC family protein n=1 Tax=Nocardioides bigeumensis TaxID=433657 RepID=A0ABN2YX21_9ACTN